MLRNRRNFESRFNQNRSFLDIAFKGIFTAVVIFFLLWICFVGWGASKVINADWSHGLKGVIENVWCGDKGCK